MEPNFADLDRSPTKAAVPAIAGTPAKNQAAPPAASPRPTQPAPTRLGTVQTELDQIIAGLTWLEAFRLGDGINAVTGSQTASALLPFTVQQQTVKSSQEHYRFIQSDSAYNQEVETSVSGKYNIEGVTVSASAKYLEKVKYSELTTTLLASYEVAYNGYDEATDYQFTEAAKGMLDKPDQFRGAFGDYFIAGYQRGARFMAVYACQATTAEKMTEFQTSFGAETPDVFTAEGSARFMSAASSHSITITCDLFMEGYQGVGPEGPWTPEKILEALDWFKANATGIPVRAKLKHYSTIDPAYPHTVDIVPDVFVELRRLYTKVWDVRSRYHSCPAHYQPQFASDFNALDTGVTSKQDILATDQAQRLQYEQQADALLSGLNDVMDRMDFYFKVLNVVGTEPANGATIDEGNGQQAWLYGFNVYTKSPAVTIHSTTLNYKDSWHVGWRDHTFEFGPDGTYLIVGWEVVSNWNDGTNGSWEKKVNQILLTSQAAVYVKSLYDRGCDWSFTVYFVDAKDYQFQ
ncbi:MAG: hypothetical protein ICV83_04090 [Cytophagales bacterium]|nr:hypothetical protein [Cytophagales bacterium]